MQQQVSRKIRESAQGQPEITVVTETPPQSSRMLAPPSPKIDATSSRAIKAINGNHFGTFRRLKPQSG